MLQYGQSEQTIESFKQDALNSWVQHQETGRHLTGKEMRTWLNA
jgi:predicted transcriptional regulator